MGDTVHVTGVGLVTDAINSVADAGRGKLPGFEVLPAEGVSSDERLAGLAIRAAHQAYTMAGLAGVDRECVAILYVSCWGSIDATVAYLDSMLEGDGKYASPRHFSRSVYSAVASAVAMHFKVHGPCMTLAFPAADAVDGAMAAARRLVAAGRAMHVLVVWAEQFSPLVADLARRAAEGLGDRESRRYMDGSGEGAAAAVVCGGEASSSGLVRGGPSGGEWPGKPYAMDGAAAWVSGFRLLD